MRLLAIETSCDETAAAVVEDGRRVLSNVVNTQIDLHRLYGGVVPEIASRKHIEQIDLVVREALAVAKERAACEGCTAGEALERGGATDKTPESAGAHAGAASELPAEEPRCRMVGDQTEAPDGPLDLAGIDAVAVTAYPGLIGALLTGVNFAKGLSFASGLPLVPVHHIRGHIAGCYLSHPELEPPFLCLIVSGGHSNLAVVEDYCKIRVIARTRDDAAGECFDKVARVLGLPYPGGVALDKLSAGVPAPGDYQFPDPKVEGSPLDFSFSGLKTAAINRIHNAAQKGEEIDKVAFSADFSEAVTGILLSRVELALRETGLARFAVAGGVSANSRLRAGAERLAKRLGRRVYFPELRYCGDNAAMIGSAGFYEFQNGARADSSLNAKATMSIE